MKTKVEYCKKINNCEKIKIILDKDLLESQYADAIISVCLVCKGMEV